MPTSRWSLVLLPVLLTATAACSSKATNTSSASTGSGGSGASTGSSGGSGGSGGSTASGAGAVGPGTDPCTNTNNPPGTVVPLPWPAADNTGHDAVPGDTVSFTWSGTVAHNVLQVATFTGQTAPVPTLGDALWAGEITSGAKQNDGAFDWNVGTFSCGYRPGIYFFVDEDSPPGGIVSVSLTDYDMDGSHYGPRPCSTLSDPSVYDARYASFATRAGCTVHEVNNFQTETHFDWVQPAFDVTRGDLMVFRWTGLHNIVQVHDVTEDMPVPGGIDSGPKTNCVGGPHYACVNGPASLGELAFDSATWRPGVIHISDQCALCNGSPTGMNMEFNLQRPRDASGNPLPAPTAGTCCGLSKYKSKGAGCRVVDIYNDGDGAQFNYQTAAAPTDIVRFRWAGSLNVFQVTPTAGGTPSTSALSGGAATPGSIECIPGPDDTCLGGNTAAAELIVDVAAQIAAGKFELTSSDTQVFYFHAVGENTPGYTSADTNAIVYVEGAAAPFTPCPP
jgi:hypothetical protein